MFPSYTFDTNSCLFMLCFEAMCINDVEEEIILLLVNVEEFSFARIVDVFQEIRGKLREDETPENMLK